MMEIGGKRSKSIENRGNLWKAVKSGRKQSKAVENGGNRSKTVETVKIGRNRWKTVKIGRKQWKSVEISRKRWKRSKSVEIGGKRSKSVENSGNRWKSVENGGNRTKKVKNGGNRSKTVETGWKQAELLVKSSKSNRIVSLLQCFHSVSALKINLQKSSLYGIGVNHREISNLASFTGCSPQQLPFTYLGIPVASKMPRIKEWNPIIEKFKKRLSKWKANMLSIGGRSTLITSVLGSLGVYYISLFPMPKQVNKRLESLRANFFWGCTDGIKNSMDILEFVFSFKAERWSWIVGAINDKGIIPHSSIKRQVKDGSATRFWRDAWLGDIPLEHQFPCLFCLEANKDCLCPRQVAKWLVWCWTRNFHGGVTASQLDSLISMLVNVKLTECHDAWQWNLIGSNIFTVKDILIYIDSISLSEFPTETRWCHFIPRRINILVWHILRDRIPTRWNLSMKGFEVSSLLCPLCNIARETSSHLFWTCNLATSV
uniref:Reverse transcriptase domain, reverse transcriptase zinc-binding domain protein n=1 Tax=Tanacetum cinerariifolium TaxID=118510 RepID=A0A6L2JP32_TANCI|nr:reverse transcriptase domain, reverse transcriptase zinc-binding domain protein [Tanacetum cinerariifolium]